MNRTRVLILWASVGAGHGRAAQAVELALRQQLPGAFVRNVDVLDLTGRRFRRLYGQGYFGLIARAPHLVGYLYDRLDRPLRPWERAADKIRFALQRLNLRALEALLTDEPWDLAINTHFLPAEVIAAFRRWGWVDFPQVTVTTDFDTHRLWVADPCEHYFTATEEGRANLAAWGIPPHRITAAGIPVHPVFARVKDKHECRRRLGLADDRPVVLQLSGGLGIGPVEAIHRRLLDVATPMQLVTITGRNAAAKEALQALPSPSRHQRQLPGFTDQIDEYMAAADVIVSKPGGLTTSEALCRGAVLMIVDPIPGQETRNSDYLLECGAAVKVNNLASLPYKLTCLLSDPGRRASMQAAALRLARPQAAFEVAHRAMHALRTPIHASASGGVGQENRGYELDLTADATSVRGRSLKGRRTLPACPAEAMI